MIKIDNRKLKQIAFDKGLFPAEIITKTKISSGEIYKILNGQRPQIFDRTAYALSKALKCKVNDFKII